MKKNHPKKEYKEYVYATTNVTNSLEIEFSSQERSILIKDAIPSSIKTKVEYTRLSGKEKVVNVSPCSGGSSQIISPDQQLLSNYDYIFAIDTNTKVIQFTKISVCVVYFTEPRRYKNVEGVHFKPLLSFMITNVKPEVNPETVGWFIFLVKYLKTKTIKPTYRLAVIVDSELDKHEMINDRSIPYYDQYYLDENVKFVYASADVGKNQYLANMMISYCDAMSAKVLAYLNEKITKLPVMFNGDGNFDGFIPIAFKGI